MQVTSIATNLDATGTGNTVTVQFTGANHPVLNSPTAGRYTRTTPPRQMGLTVRMDFHVSG